LHSISFSCCTRTEDLSETLQGAIDCGPIVYDPDNHANRFMREIRDRMPVILDSSLVADWLDLEIQDRKDLEQILKPCPDAWLTKAEVSLLVNSSKNDGPELLEPATMPAPTIRSVNCSKIEGVRS